MFKSLALATVMFVTMAPAQTQYLRPSDTDVKNLIAQIGQARDRFQDALDSNLKRSILRGASGEVNVDRFLDDLKRNVSLVKDRFNDQYSASAEVLTLLRQGTDIHGFVTSQSATFKGRSEWDVLAGWFGTLATAYGTSFPLPQGASARRMNDKEVAASADGLARTAEQFRKAATKAMKTAKADPKLVTAVDNGAKGIATAAANLKSRVSSHKPATNEARILIEQVVRLKSMLTEPQQGEAATAWEGVLSATRGIGVAFSLPGV
jgi:hypothetical protein